MNEKHYQYVAIIAFGRSGSTMLQHAMNLSPEATIRGESYNMPLHGYRMYESAHKAKTICPQDHTSDKPWFGSPSIPLDDLLISHKQMFDACLLRPEPSSRILGWKEIRHVPSSMLVSDWEARLHPIDYKDMIGYLKYLRELFPGIKFIINSRDPVTASNSSWWSQDVEKSRRGLAVTCEWFDAIPKTLSEYYHCEVAFRVRYEDWATDPASLIHAWKFLGLSWNSEELSQAFKEKINSS